MTDRTYTQAEVDALMAARIEELEAKNKRPQRILLKECGFRIRCYWDAQDRELGYSDVSEILDKYPYGSVIEVEHVAVIASTFEAILPAAHDAETDDFFEVSECTREAANDRISAEITRRDAIRAMKEGE